MSEPFLAEVRLMGFNFAPRGWAFCDGQILPINQNQSLYSLLGTIYGGDGRTSFALPDLRGRTPIHVGNSNGGEEHELGQKGGEEAITLSTVEMPSHDHTAQAANSEANQNNSGGNILAAASASTFNLYISETSTPTRQPITSSTVTNVGGSQSHNNMQPYFAVNFCIALQGLFPSRN